jgi:hypothetical protein
MSSKSSLYLDSSSRYKVPGSTSDVISSWVWGKETLLLFTLLLLLLLLACTLLRL